MVSEEMEVNEEKADDKDNFESEDYESDDSLMEERSYKLRLHLDCEAWFKCCAEVIRRKLPIMDKKRWKKFD